MNQAVTDYGKKIEQNTQEDILVVEDSKIIQNMIKNVLDFTKYNVVLTNRGKDAIENVNIFYPLTYENSIDLDKVEEWD